MSDIQITFAVIVAIVALFIWNRLPVELVAIGATLVLWATGVISLNQAIGGFGDATVIFIASLFVVSEGLDATGATSWVGQKLILLAGEGRTRLIVLMMLIVAALTALISVNGAVAALLPVVVVMAVRLARAPSQLMMPLVFGAHAGSLLALTGTPVHVLIVEASRDAGAGGFGFFSFALVGIPLLAGTIAIVVLLGERLLPTRTPTTLPPDLSRHARTLVEEYRLTDAVARLRLRDGSPWVGRTRAQLELAADSLALAQAPRAGEAPLAAGDEVLVKGSTEAIVAVAGAADLAVLTEGGADDLAGALVSRTSGLAEVLVPPRSALIGETVFPGMASDAGDLVVLGVRRTGTPAEAGPVALAAGDVLLLQGSWDALDARLAKPDLLVVDAPDIVRRQAVPMGPGARSAVAILAGMVVLLATGVVPPVVAGLLAAMAMVATRVLTMQGAYRGINWTTVVLVGAMIPLSTAMVQSGAADAIAERLVDLVRDAGPYALLAGLFAITAVFGQLISNMATALIVIPIAIAAATGLGVSVQPVLMSVTVAAAAALLTPVATPVNLMVMGPGGYRFGDYWKLGLPILGLFFVVSVFLVPVFWPF
jgi:di/tricarboxylate transporter